jgi:hypothetical protein
LDEPLHRPRICAPKGKQCFVGSLTPADPCSEAAGQGAPYALTTQAGEVFCPFAMKTGIEQTIAVIPYFTVLAGNNRIFAVIVPNPESAIFGKLCDFKFIWHRSHAPF